MSDLEILLAYAKQCHEAKDATDILDIAYDIQQLENLYQRGNWNAVSKFIQTVVDKHKAEVAEYDKGHPPAQNIQQQAQACYNFLVKLSKEKSRKRPEKNSQKKLWSTWEKTNLSITGSKTDVGKV